MKRLLDKGPLEKDRHNDGERWKGKRMQMYSPRQEYLHSGGDVVSQRAIIVRDALTADHTDLTAHRVRHYTCMDGC